MKVDLIKTFLRTSWIFLSIASIGLFLILSFYNCPASDDFYYARWMREWGFADANITIYYAWGGRYFSNILLTLFNALSYSFDYKDFLIPYQFHSVTHIILFVLSTIILFRRFSLLQYWWLALVPLAYFVQKANLISEFFYWLAGTVTYCSGYIFGCTALACTLDIIYAGNQKKSRISARTLLFSLAGLLVAVGGILTFKLHKFVITFFNAQPLVFLFIFSGCILFSLFHLWRSGSRTTEFSPVSTWFVLVFSMMGCAGSSELSGAMLIITLGFVWLWFGNAERLKDPVYYVPQILSVLALAINVFAPSTQNRQATVDQSLLHNWPQAFQMGIYIFKQGLHLVPLFLTGFFLSVLFSNSTPNPESGSALKLKTVFFVSYSALLGFVLPVLTCYQSGILPERAVNAHVLIMAITFFIYAWYLGTVFHKFIGIKYNMIVLTGNVLMMLYFVTDSGRNNISTGIYDLWSGEASSFLKQFKQQQESILACTTDTCEEPRNTSTPKSLCYGPNGVVLGEDFVSIINYKTNAYAYFYGKKFIFQKPESKK